MPSQPPPTTFARLRYRLNQTKAGKPTSTHAYNTVTYMGRGKGDNRLEAGHYRGHWFSPDGSVTHQEVAHWANASAKQYPYTYEAILSARNEHLTPDQWSAIMQTGMDNAKLTADWRLIAHDDTSHAHAHAIFFSDKKLNWQQVVTWHREITQELDQQQTLTREVTIAKAQQQQREYEYDAGLSL